MHTVLIVDDEKNYPPIISAILTQAGFETMTAFGGQEALPLLREGSVDLVLTDMKMPEMDGIALLENIRAKDPDLPVVMMTAHGTVEKAVEAMQKGADNYILKPFDNQRLIITVQKAVDMYQVIKENRSLKDAFKAQYRFGNIIGKSKPMRTVFDLIRKVAPTNATVLVEGDSGTGKELVAKSIHYNSPRQELPFVAVNCSALSETLLESELFGHEKGAFTGANARKKGRFELAHTGTLLLDEIGELSLNLQVKLLRVLQERQFERVGGVTPIPVDIRLIAATNKKLKEEVTAGRFREDLFYRLNVVHIELPTLSERTADIPLLASHFLEKYAGQRVAQKAVKGVTQAVMRRFYNYAWPGNVRELENIIERAVILCADEYIDLDDLPEEFSTRTGALLNLDDIPEDAGLYETLALVEKEMILRALQVSNYVQTRAAEKLKIGKSGLNQKIKKYNLELPSKS